MTKRVIDDDQPIVFARDDINRFFLHLLQYQIIDKLIKWVSLVNLLANMRLNEKEVIQRTLCNIKSLDKVMVPIWVTEIRLLFGYLTVEEIWELIEEKKN